SILLMGFDTLSERIDLATQLEEKDLLLDQLATRLVRPYTVMTVTLTFLGLLICFMHLPEVEDKGTDTAQGHSSIWRQTRLWFGVIALFFYVGVEVIAGDTIIKYGMSLGIAQESAKYFTSFTLIAMVIGYFVGVVLIPKVINQRQALIGCAVVGIALAACAVIVPKGLSVSFPFIDLDTFSQIQMHVPITVLFVALLGLANALVWPAIWPLALEGAGEHTKTGSALLIMAIAGGATLPLLYGKMSGIFGTQTAYLVAIPCYLVILAFAIYCRKRK
ncbi:MAG: hypothetical protein J5605_08335, partial [Bacteroidales bacterium]|nr:hypothetical protein [Bacteroidales bacterium]